MQSMRSWLVRRVLHGSRQFSSTASVCSVPDGLAEPSSLAQASVVGRELSMVPRFKTPRLAWVESLGDHDGTGVRGMVHLHPDMFADTPDISIIHKNVAWQTKYRHVASAIHGCSIFLSFSFTSSGGGRKVLCFELQWSILDNGGAAG